MLQYSTIQLDAVDCAFNLRFLTNEPSATEEIRGAEARKTWQVTASAYPLMWSTPVSAPSMNRILRREGG